MVFFNYALRKLNAKIVYYGPGLCGKTTNLLWIHDHFEGGDRGKMISLATEGDRTIFFDLLPLDIGAIRGMNVTLQLYTVPGQVHYNSTRQLVLRGADGVVFVADSQRAMQSSNIESFRNLQENLLLQGISLEGFPLVLQFNKRDLRDTLAVEELDTDLNLFRVPIFEAVATEGVGVQETLEGIVKLVMRNLRERYEGVAPDARDPATTMRVGGGPKPAAAAGPKPAPPPGVPPVAPARPPAAAKPAAAPPVKPPPPKAAPQPPAPRPAPESRPARPAPAREPEAPRRAPPAASPPPDEIVFPQGDAALTADLSRTRSPGPGAGSGGRGFEDEVSTAVYELDERDEAGGDDLDQLRARSDAAARAAGAVPFADEPTSAARPARDHEFAIGGGGGLDFEMDDFAEPPAREAPPPARPAPVAEPPAAAEPEHAAFDDEEPEIEFMTPAGGLEGPPPALETPPPSERYVDRIEAPSPFAPRSQAGPQAPRPAAEAAPEEAPSEPAPPPDRPAPRETPFAAAESLDEPSLEPAEPPTWEAGQEDDAAELPELSGDLDPFQLGDGDPFAAPPPAEGPATPPPAAIERAARREVDVRAEDNQLHLRLQGTGAIVESGQVRALDIEVPVPGSWVGNRRVTLQLRLTLTPDSEDGNGGSGGHS